MKNNFWASIQQIWYILPLIFIVGIATSLLFPKRARAWFHRLYERMQLLKRYWIFVSIFSPLSALGYIFIFQLAPSTEKGLILDTYNEVLTLVFAIFVGYFAFIQVLESRFDKLQNQATDYIDNGQDYFDKAIKCYEECIKINGNDFDIWANLMEFYLILKKSETFDDKLYLFKRTIKSPRDWVTYYYLLAARELLAQRLGEARQAIEILTTFVQEHPTSLRSFAWRFKDVTDSDLFDTLEPVTQKIYKNMSRYLLKELSTDEKFRFEGGDYELNHVAVAAQA